MTDAVVHHSGVTSRRGRFAAALGSSLRKAVIAHRTRRALDQLPDDQLRDIGLTRNDIVFVADAVASGDGDPTRDARDRLNRTVAEHGATARGRPRGVLRLALAAVVAVSSFVIASRAVPAQTAQQDAQIERGKYLVGLAGCNDCHTPGYFFGKPDMVRFLGGSEVGFEIPGLGVFHGPNLTPDRDTGLGQWSTDEIATAITTGRRPDGRILAPIMPWHAFANLTRQDVGAIVTFLKSLPPVKNKVPGPFGPREKPTSFVMKIVPPPHAPMGDAATK